MWYNRIVFGTDREGVTLERFVLKETTYEMFVGSCSEHGESWKGYTPSFSGYETAVSAEIRAQDHARMNGCRIQCVGRKEFNIVPHEKQGP